MIYLILVIIVMIIMYFVNRTIKVTTYQLEDKKLPSSFHGKKIVLLTDLHNQSFGKNNIKLIENINKQKPDYIMIAGDLIIGNRKFIPDKMLHFLKELANTYEVFYAPGNHELKLSLFSETKDSSYKYYKKQLNKMGIHFLENQTFEIEENNERINVVGLSIQKKYYAKEWNKVRMDSQYISSLVGPGTNDRYSILIAHHPKYFKQYASWGANLILSGHIHGGVIILPKLGGFISPSYEFFPEYDYGMFQKNESTLIISKGLGLHTIKLRVGHFPEITVIQLKKSC
jgi:uncharacterized protein